MDKDYMAWCHKNETCLLHRKYYEARYVYVNPGVFELTCDGLMTFHHVRFCGSPKDDRHGLILCEAHHFIQKDSKLSVEAGKKLFEARYGVNLEAEAKAMYERYLVATGRSAE